MAQNVNPRFYLTTKTTNKLAKLLTYVELWNVVKINLQQSRESLMKKETATLQ